MKKTTVSAFAKRKAAGEKLVMCTAYDAPFAAAVLDAGIDIMLIGDSVGTTLLGYSSTLPVSMDDMIRHTQAVRRGAPEAFLVGDMPFMSYQASIVEGMHNAARFLKETGCTAVKLEGGSEVCELVQKLTQAGIPVVAHIGLTPQSVNQLGGFKVQGKDVEAAKKLIDDAKALESAGAFACVLECVPAALASKITQELTTMATIGIGAGNGCDGQVLVCNDLLGVSDGFCPKFVKRYADIHSITVNAVKSYINEVKDRSFPAPEHTFKIDDTVLEKLY